MPLDSTLIHAISFLENKTIYIINENLMIIEIHEMTDSNSNIIQTAVNQKQLENNSNLKK